MAGFSGPNIVTDGLLFSYDPANKKSYPGSGTTVTDLSKNGHTIGLSSSPTFSGNNVGCFDHGAGTGANINISSHSSFVTAKSWEIWFNPDTIPANSTADSVWSHTNNWNQNTGKGMHMIYGNFTFDYGKNWTGACQHALSNFTAGNWYHAVGTTDGTTNANKVKLYINGSLVDTGTSTVIPSDSPNIKVGDGNGGNIDGKTGSFSVYSKELSAEEVLKNFTTKKSRFGL